jgi:hypothetical protein
MRWAVDDGTIEPMDDRRPRLDRDDRPDLDVFEDRRRRWERGEDDGTSADPTDTPPADSTQAQQGGPGVFELSGRFLDDVVDWGSDQLDTAGEAARDVADSMTGFATKAAEVVASGANFAWEGATGGGDDDDEGDDSDGGESSGGDTISGGDLVELQSSPAEPIDAGVYVEEISPPPEEQHPVSSAPDGGLDPADDVFGDDLLT